MKINSKNIKNIQAISWNVCWEAFAGVNLRNKKYSVNGKNIETKKESKKLSDQVKKNFSDFLKKYQENTDFFLFQEASTIHSYFSSSMKKKFGYFKSISNKNELYTVYSKKFHPISKYIIRSNFTDGRPYIIVPFKENICIINVHFPHTEKLTNKTGKDNISFQECIKKIEKDLKKIQKKVKIKTIVLGGDFNKNKIKDFEWNFSKREKEFFFKMKNIEPKNSKTKTCCFLNDSFYSYLWNLDHFFVNNNPLILKEKLRILKPKKPTSDHNPILLNISFHNKNK
jgi:hypothetical protein